MSGDPSVLCELRGRLDRMERALRRWRRGAAALLSLAAIVAVAGARSDPAARELRVETLKIVDREGKERIVLTAEPKVPDMTFYDPDGQRRLTLDIADDHKPVLQFAAPGAEKGRLTLGIEAGDPMLQIFDHTGKKRVSFGVPRGGGPALRILDENEQLRSRFP